MTAQALERRDPQRRYPILLTLLAQSATDVLDEVVQLFDQAISARESKAERKMRDALAERGKAGEDRQALLDDLLAIITDPQISDEQIGGLIRGERIGWPRLRSAVTQAAPRLPRDHGHLAALDGSYGYLRQFTPQVLAAVRFAGGTASAGLLEALEILRELNATGARRVPADAPDGFVPARWRGYLETAAKSGNTSAYRHYWELCTLLALRDGLRSGDVFVPGSRRYSDPAAYLLTPDKWVDQRAEFCQLVGKPADPDRALAAAADELGEALGELEGVLAAGDGPVRLDDGGDLVISPLTAEDVPAEATALKAELTEMLPFAPIRALSRYFASEGLSTYTHVTDQHTTYGTKVIVATKREAHYVLDGILGNATDIPVTEHATDTHGVTLVNFGLFDLLGLQLSLRIRDLGKITLYRAGSRAQVEADFPHTGPLLTRKLNTDLIAEHYDDLLRLAGSLKFGHATASLLVGKLSAAGRQNALAAALKEYGALRRTIYAARYLADPAYRRKISRQLNKGESLHALKRDLLYAHEGAIRARHLEAQTEQAWCLTLATNAVVAWTTEYYGLAVESMRRAGRRIDDEVLAHISPAHSENINFFGAIEVDIEGELAQLGPTGYRPLRVRDTLF
ncbi:Tn3 family transposase [Streptosporangium sp. NPDC087985]|uniref:Tn3 family transposase n=1 Tax=Streptosporangium sp. NPDC087985 TaxID=3366196 RepID=UPI00380F02B0